MGHSIGSSGKTYEKTPRQRNPQRGLVQGSNDDKRNHYSHLFSHGRVEKNGALRGDNNGRFGGDGVCFRNGGSNSISSTRKTYKDIKRKGNSRRELQRRAILRSNSLH